ncbi:phosphate ABC transporter permease subunit PstC [Mycobacterium sp. CBMA293]|uniref:phosphate ABC transporter permease subunit PstC n=1 Tax=unclassified Mycolicibacterium TaxID=2636767 RepID=UPI0012DBFA72|nr:MULTISPECIES: phosphate ABC transporter permease subunit PstC [unclassified Mycolicibacterium]MUL47655.1 phosphate ABC transporter permease subunit PstC [Mycolicibacterium sp. CBMA 360]MUL61827.1 phosphate ABC transporter permease subunit PstC [Mycolicibacterium sp. CBMA 335]MUL64324.1 phosphate ABC transporter permease subunit PstC [Mycolicibacterium sp. CBMA 234]MUL70891.1 phosphate ABC transporter permease subunit PstC [Mycolicibacterium sp. CBMA 311]MUL92883.1 phosphate ABC transporter 
MSDAPTQQKPDASGPVVDGAGGAPASTVPEESISTPQPAAERGTVVRPADRIFSLFASGSATLVTAIIAAIGIFLVALAVPALQRNQASFLFSREWNTTDINKMAFGVLDLFQVTVLVSFFALLLAMPVALGIAIFLTEYCPARVKRPLAYVIDLLAAVPSIVYGLWGLLVLAPTIRPAAEWFNSTFSWFFLFQNGSGSVPGGRTIFTAGIVLAVMILPIITAVTREVFVQTPVAHIEAALALGATRWEVVRTTIIPFGRSGYISGSMLGLGRALGETMALYLILATVFKPFSWSLFDGGATIASKIALGYAEFNNNIQAGAYIAAGLVLFVLTFAVNATARAIVGGKRD